MSKTLFNLRVGDVSQRDVVSVSKEDTVSFALGLMVQNRTAALPVVNSTGGIVGMFSASDIVGLVHDLDEEMRDPAEPAPQWLMTKLRDHDLERQSVADLMSTDVATIARDNSLRDAAATMLRNRVHRLPVVEKDDRVIGIVSTTDILEAFVEHCPEELPAEA
ncbi:MAG: CBS domain-containing protein [Pirellulales bacterium]|nr:CBS domain-containing protein [Pirellulales bacterium]